MDISHCHPDVRILVIQVIHARNCARGLGVMDVVTILDDVLDMLLLPEHQIHLPFDLRSTH